MPVSASGTLRSSIRSNVNTVTQHHPERALLPCACLALGRCILQHGEDITASWAASGGCHERWCRGCPDAGFCEGRLLTPACTCVGGGCVCVRGAPVGDDERAPRLGRPHACAGHAGSGPSEAEPHLPAQRPPRPCQARRPSSPLPCCMPSGRQCVHTMQGCQRIMQQQCSNVHRSERLRSLEAH